MNFKKLFLTAAIAMSMASANLTAQVTVVGNGTAGNLNWELTSDSLLTIYGNDTMPNYTSTTTPWYSYRNAITSVVIGDSVKTIGNNVFYNYSTLVSVTIGDSVKTIGIYVFYNCSNLVSLTIGNSVKTIGNFAFRGCSSLTTVTIPNSVTIIGNYAFRGCGLTTVTIPNNVTSI